MRRTLAAGALTLALVASGGRGGEPPADGAAEAAKLEKAAAALEQARAAYRAKLAQARQARERLEREKGTLEKATRELDAAVGRATQALGGVAKGGPGTAPGALHELRRVFVWHPEVANLSIRIESRGGQFALVAGTFRVEEDGRAHLAPAYLRLAGTPGGQGAVPATRLRAKEVRLKFDKPVRELNDLTGHTPVELELTGDACFEGFRDARLLASSLKVALGEGECCGSPRRVEAVGDIRGQLPGKTEIKGDKLTMACGPKGASFAVTGDLAQVQMGKIRVLGREVNVDQAAGRVCVYGPGSLQVESTNDLHGKPLDRPGLLTCRWSASMFCNGESADFRGGVQAEQGGTRLTSQNLLLQFDGGAAAGPGGAAVRVRQIVCDRSAHIEERAHEEGELVPTRLLTAASAEFRVTDEGEQTCGAGPGTLKTLRRAGKGKERHLTYVKFDTRMDANRKTGATQFWGGVRVLSMTGLPFTEPSNLDGTLVDKLPERALLLRCDRLKVLDWSGQQVEARGDVFVQGREFYARAGAVFYDRAKGQVVLDGGEGGQVTLQKLTAGDTKPEEITGKKVVYNLATGQVKAEGAAEKE